MTPEEKLASLGIVLPELPKPLGSYVPYVKTGNLLYVSGMLPLQNGKLVAEGRVGAEVTLEQANTCSRITAVNCLSVVRSAAGSLLNVSRCVRVEGFVASDPGFTDQPKVINGASDLMYQVFGEAGLHTRAAVGVNVLPMNSPVEITFIFEFKM